jgi:hypothetical protein
MGKNKDRQIELQEINAGLYDEEGNSDAHNNDDQADAVVHQKYFEWLTSPLAEERPYKRYKYLLSRLHSIPFTHHVPNDDNRAYDGEHLRDVFIDAMGLGEYEFSLLIQRPCSVLEMIVALSIRIPDFINRKSPAGWFWELMDNLDLTRYSDDCYYTEGGVMYVRDIVHNFLKRNYTFNGNGGLFPLMKTQRKDQRKVEIWYQMQEYLNENYQIDFE